MRRTLVITTIASLMASTAIATAANYDKDEVQGNSSSVMEATKSDPGVAVDALHRGESVTAGVSTFNEVLVDEYAEVEMDDGTMVRQPRRVSFDTDNDGTLDTEGQVVSYSSRGPDGTAPVLYYVDVDGDGEPETWIIRRTEFGADTKSTFVAREDTDVETEDEFYFDPEFDWFDEDNVAYDDSDKNINFLDATRSDPGTPADVTGSE